MLRIKESKLNATMPMMMYSSMLIHDAMLDDPKNLVCDEHTIHAHQHESVFPRQIFLVHPEHDNGDRGSQEEQRGQYLGKIYFDGKKQPHQAQEEDEFDGKRTEQISQSNADMFSEE